MVGELDGEGRAGCALARAGEGLVLAARGLGGRREGRERGGEREGLPKVGIPRLRQLVRGRVWGPARARFCLGQLPRIPHRPPSGRASPKWPANTHRYLRFHSMMSAQRRQHPAVAGMEAIFSVLREFGLWWKAVLFWYLGARLFCWPDMVEGGENAPRGAEEKGGRERGLSEKCRVGQIKKHNASEVFFSRGPFCPSNCAPLLAVCF